MINLQTIKKYCNGDITKIENYDKAIEDNTQTWQCHHRMEIQADGTIRSKKWLIEHGMYYSIDPCMLIFMTIAEHTTLHNKNRTAASKLHRKELYKNIHRTLTTEHRAKFVYSRKGKAPWNKGKTCKVINGKRVWLPKESV